MDFDAMLVKVSEGLYWIDNVSETHFFVVFRALYDQILEESALEKRLSIDNILSALTSNKLLMYPMISSGNPGTRTNFIDRRIIRMEGLFEKIDYLRSNFAEAALSGDQGNY